MRTLNRENIATQSLPIKVLQFGGGNFLRAFVNWMIEVLNSETDFNAGVAIIKPTERGDYHDLKLQNGLFTVALDGIKNGKFVAEQQLVTCIQQVVNPYTEYQNYLDLAKNADVRYIVSNTTEAGIRFNAEDAFDDHPAKEFPAKLTVWLYHRFLHFGNDSSKGCVILPCELIEENGTVLKSTVLKYAEHWNLSSDFIHWIYTSNHFCSTLVDRIVSGYPFDRAEELQNSLGYEDKLLVAGEWYHSWVIQSEAFVQEEIPFKNTNLNVQFVSDLAPYRKMKVRFLNGAHTAMVPVAYLAGIRLVNGAMDNKQVHNFVYELLSEEIAETLDFTTEAKSDYITAVLDRFTNPILKHQLISIALNSTSKFVSRLLPSFKDYYIANGKLPKRIVFSLSALILFYKGIFEGEPIAIKDDVKVLNFFADNWKKYDAKKMEINILSGIVLSNTTIWGEDLTVFQGLVDAVSHHLTTIEKQGIEVALNHL